MFVFKNLPLEINKEIHLYKVHQERIDMLNNLLKGNSPFLFNGRLVYTTKNIAECHENYRVHERRPFTTNVRQVISKDSEMAIIAQPVYNSPLNIEFPVLLFHQAADQTKFFAVKLEDKEKWEVVESFTVALTLSEVIDEVCKETEVAKLKAQTTRGSHWEFIPS